MFCKDIRKIKKELRGVPVSKTRAIISKEWEKVKASNKKMKKYRDLYEEEKRTYEEALQRYQEDHMDEMEIINLLKSCNNKVRKIARPKNAPKLSKSDDPRDDEQNPKKAPKSPEFIESDHSGKEEEEPKKALRTQDDKEKKNLLRVNGAQSFF